MKFSKIILKSKHDGAPKVSDFDIVEEEFDDGLKVGEFFYEALYVSLDPYTRVYADSQSEGDELTGYQLSKVTKSNNEKYPVGTLMVVRSGWRNGGKSNGDDVFYLRNDVPKEVPQSAGCGILGMDGFAAYYGLKYICEPKPGETLMISGASRGVGTVAGQIGKIMGCKVIGSCGSDETVAFLKSAGFDDAFNYKKESVYDALPRLAPEGVDCYFDNDGGDFSSAVIRHMNMYGRIACCEAISTYNAKQPVKADVIQKDIIAKMLLMQGLNIFYIQDKYEEMYLVLRDWAEKGKLKAYEAVTEGFENVPCTFIKMLQGKYLGKVIIKV